MGKNARRWFEITLGTGFFTGYLPLAPATWGSGLALLIFFLVPKLIWLQSLIIIFLFFYGVYLSGKLEELWGKDARRIVIDEVCGMFLSLFLLSWNWKIGIIGFLLFRFFDIVKPFPIRRSQVLHGGWGIMIDDVIAAFYTNIVLRIIILLFRW